MKNENPKIELLIEVFKALIYAYGEKEALKKLSALLDLLPKGVLA